MDTDLKDDLAREAAVSTPHVEHAAQPPRVRDSAGDTSEVHTHSAVVELGPLRAEIDIRFETLQRRIARLEGRDATDG